MKKTLAVVAACLAQAAIAQNLPAGFTCCNLHYDGDKISDANWTHAAMIPAGAPIKVISYGSNEAAVEIDGKPMRLLQEYGRKQESIEAFVAKWVVKTSPRAKIEKWPAPVREAIHAGKVAPGMTREQVIVAVGYPPTHKTLSLDAPLWTHWQSRAGRFEVIWNPEGTVAAVNGQKDKK